jgi:hypothetical protein
LKQADVAQKTLSATRQFEAGTWTQELVTSTVGSTSYIDQGSGRFERK